MRNIGKKCTFWQQSLVCTCGLVLVIAGCGEQKSQGRIAKLRKLSEEAQNIRNHVPMRELEKINERAKLHFDARLPDSAWPYLMRPARSAEDLTAFGESRQMGQLIGHAAIKHCWYR